MNFTIYKLSSGQIDRVVNCSADTLELQFDRETHAAIEGAFDDTQYYVNGSAPVAMPLKPSEFHVFDYTTKQWVDPRTPETEWPIVRATRDRLLQQSDWAALPDVPLSTEQRAEWAAYRQALRDVTMQPDPFNITWPTPPNG